MCHQPSLALFGSGSTDSYVPIYYASHMCMSFEHVGVSLHVSPLVNDSIVVD